jgi:hypothetical protein
MPEYKYSFNQNEYQTEEAILCRRVLRADERDAINVIARAGCIPFVVQRDKTSFPLTPTAHSYRIKLRVKKGVVFDAEIG